MAKLPYLQFFTGDWMKDPRVTMCSPATRGILFDLLCAMHLDGQKGEISASLERLAKVARCTPEQMQEALLELEETGAADVEGIRDMSRLVTIRSRRMHREWRERENARLRKAKQRAKESQKACHGKVTNALSEVRSQKSNTEPEARAREGGSAKKARRKAGRRKTPIPSREAAEKLFRAHLPEPYLAEPVLEALLRYFDCRRGESKHGPLSEQAVKSLCRRVAVGRGDRIAPIPPSEVPDAVDEAVLYDWGAVYPLDRPKSQTSANGDGARIQPDPRHRGESRIPVVIDEDGRERDAFALEVLHDDPALEALYDTELEKLSGSGFPSPQEQRVAIARVLAKSEQVAARRAG